MAKTRVIFNSFNSGEWSPLLEGRSDLAKYHNACKTLENMICAKHGGASRRPGTRFVNEVKTSALRTRLMPFIFSTVQAYVIEVGNLYFRFYRNLGRVESPPGTPVEVVTPYLASEVFDIHFTQSADVLYLVHPLHPPMKLSRTSDINWTLTQINFLDGPWLTERTDLTITPSATTGAITLTASAPIFQAAHVGGYFRLKHGTTWGYATVTGFTSSTLVNATVVNAFGGATPSVAFQEGAWSGVQGYPSCVTLFQQRSWWSGTLGKPDTLYASQVADYENMSPGTALDDEAITFTLASNKVNAVAWLAPSRDLLVGTSGQEWQISGGSVDTPISPANPNARAETTHGSSNVSPIQVHNAVLFLQKKGSRLREYSFDFASDAYTAPDMTIVAEHITKGGIVQMDYQQERDSVLWAIRADGQLLGMTYERTQEVIAWHRHVCKGLFESIATIPHPTADEDQAWVIVNHTIGGATKRYVEFLDTQGGFYGNLQTDAALTYSGAPVSSLSGLGHLEGQAVDVLGMGAVYPPAVVSGGAISGLNPPVTQAEVGLHFDSTLLTMRPEVATNQGTAQASHQRWNTLVVRVYNSIGVTINGDRIEFRSTADEMNQPVPLFSGDKRVTNLGWDIAGRVLVQQTQPLPLTLLALIGELSVND